MRTHLRRQGPVYALASALILLLLVTDSAFYLSLLNRMAILVIVIAGLSLMFGFAGQLSLSQAGLYAVGAYASALVVMRLGVPIPVGLMMATTITGVVSYVLARPILRLRDFYLAMATLALGQIVAVVLVQQKEITGGAMGLPAVPRIVPSGVDERLLVATTWIFALATFAYSRNLMHSHVGAGLRLIAASESGATSVGIDVTRHLTWMFVIGGALAGLGGALHAHSSRFISPDLASLSFALLLVIALAVGGMYSIWGALAGAAFVTLVPIWLAGSERLASLLFGIVFLVAILVLPDGLMGAIERLARRVLGKRRVPPRQRAVIAEGSVAPSVPDAVGREVGAVVLRATGIHKRFGGLHALANANVEVRQGEILGLVGPNGAGKTTLLNCISGYLVQDEGHVYIGEKDVTTAKAHERVWAGMGRVFQTPQLAPGLTTRENVALGKGARKQRSILAGGLGGKRVGFQAEDRVEVERLMSELGLTAVSDEPVGSLSFGHQRFAELARALIDRPIVLLLDEPSAGLSTAEIKSFGAALQHRVRRDNLAVILVEHNVALVLALADRVTVLDQGRSLFDGGPREFLTDPRVVEAYLGSEFQAAEAS